MDDESRGDDVVSGLHRLGEADELLTAELRRTADMLVLMLTRGGQLDDAQAAALAERLPTDRGPRVELEETVDKRAVENSEVDCGARMHLCHGRCCAFNVKMSRQDIEEGRLAFRLDKPYYLKQDAAGYCVHQQHDTGFCGAYDDRPALCRKYECRGDPRIWIDFDAMIPAPMPVGLVQIRRKVSP